MFQIIDLQKAFHKQILFQNLNMTLLSGKAYALVGKSGSGKTTLLNMLANLEPYDSGSIIYNGKELSEWKKQLFYREELGYLFQNFGLIENETVRENLDLALMGDRSSRSDKDRKQKEALHSVQLDYVSLDDKVDTLSGGEAQRVSLARTILKDPPLVFADEPTAALDSTTSEQIMDLVLRMKKDNRIIVVATHDPTVWNRMDEVIRLD
ncbi:MAG: putative bacteriocin export ABC transporter [Gallicola sp.]|nr:putative bacteriocin export ABC transporter [Gallicola sp.]